MSTFFDSTPTLTRSLFQSIVEHASDGIMVVDLDGYVVFCNPALARIFQRAEDEFEGELFGFPIAAHHTTELDILQRDNSLAIAEMRVSEAYWEGERVFIAMLRDITDRKQMEQTLRQTKEELDALYRCAPLGIVALRTDWRVKLLNPAAENILGWKADEITGSLFPELAKVLQREIPAMDDSVQHGAIVMGKELRHIRKDGTPVDVSLSMAPVHDDAGRAAGIMCIIEDISRRIRDVAQLQLSGKIFEHTHEAIVVTDTLGFILAVNQAFVTITGYSEAEAVGHKPSLLKSGRHDHTFYARMWRALLTEGQWRGEIWNRRKNGEIYPEWINISAIHDDNGKTNHYVAIFSDISKIKENEDRLRYLAHFDALTNLPNRFLFQDHVELALAQASRNGRQVAIMFLDLDHFKTINDTLGHRAGDTLLTEVAQRLTDCLRAGDTLSRFGGDEFNAVLPDIENGNAAASVAEKFVAVLSTPFFIEDRELMITTSIGIAIYPQDGNNLEQLTHAADSAMFRAKEQGRNAYRFYQAEIADENESAG
jgi:diguanylate cyclase (GGDEF)-like protein/PAS domain S-box-containing protein